MSFDGDIPDERNITEAFDQWDSGIEFGPGSNTYRLVDALLSQADRIDDDLEAVYDQQHINSATGENLDKFGNLVNVSRQTGESDARYRVRIKARLRAATIEPTFDQFVQFVASVLNTSNENIGFTTNYGGDPATVTVSAPQDIYDSVALTESEVADILGEGVPAGHEVQALVGGTFRLRSDGEISDPDKGLTSDSISTGGTLAEDIV